jgi:hypothetical protein
MRAYKDFLKATLSPAERAVFQKLNSPQKIQTYLDDLRINFETEGETLMSPRRVLRTMRAHCIEGALFAATALAYHGRPPLLLDLQTIEEDEDHVVALFKENGLWGAISKTNHAMLRWRDPVYKTVRELSMSYFHEYVFKDGRKSLRAFSKPFDMRKYKPALWVTPELELEWIAEGLDASPHSLAVPKKMIRALRRASALELQALDIAEWNTNGKIIK